MWCVLVPVQSVPGLKEKGSQTVLSIGIESNEPKDGKDKFYKGTLQVVDCRANQMISASKGLMALRHVIEAASNGEVTAKAFAASQLPNMLRDVIAGATLTRCAAVGHLRNLVQSRYVQRVAFRLVIVGPFLTNIYVCVCVYLAHWRCFTKPG